MRLAIYLLITAIMLVTIAVARSSSHKEENKRHQHQQQQVFDLMRQQRSWNNISTFPFGEEEVLPLALVPNGRKKKKQQSRNKEWPGTKKHKRKMAALSSMAEQDRRLSLLQLPQMPSSSSQYPAEHPSGLECCPTVVEMVQPNGGTNMEGHVVALYRHGDLDQRIYEHSCRPDVLDQPCRFVEKLLRPLSRCVQQYSFTYAVVADQPSGGNHGGSDWRLDYIRIRNGCACQIAAP